MNRRAVTFLATEGKLTYSRYLMAPADDVSRARLAELRGGASTVFPLDEHLGLDGLPFKVTCEAALTIALAGASSPSYAAAADELRELRGLDVSASTVQRVTNHVGGIVLARNLELAAEAEAAYDPGEVRAGRVRGRIPRDALTLYIQMDGAMYNSVDRREGRGRGTGRWRESKLGIAFRSTDLTERDLPDGTREYRVGGRQYVSSVDGVEDFRRQLLPLAMRNGLMDAHNVVIIGDGAPWIRNTRDELFPYAVLILDLYHLKENVGEFARFALPAGEASGWAREANGMLEQGRWREFLRLPEVAPYASADTPEGVVNIHRYVRANRDAIDYPKYRRRGYFVGSGAIESGNRSVMQARLKRAGMHWRSGLAGGVLCLRCELMGGRWDDFVVPTVRERYKGSARTS